MTLPDLTADKQTLTLSRGAKLGLVMLLAVLGWRAFHDQYVPMLMDIDTAVHEFGHALFRPFGIEILGNTMVILGGSLFQVVFPLLFAGYFLMKGDDGRRRDPYAAALCVWWSSVNLVSVAVYCADARALDLTLLSGLTGKEDDGHDWNNLLTRWHLLKSDLIIARRMRGTAVLMCVASLGSAAWMAITPPPPAAPEQPESARPPKPGAVIPPADSLREGC